jgi:hypothetical protein
MPLFCAPVLTARQGRSKARRVLPDTIGGQPPLPVANDCPATLEAMLGDA